MTEIAKTLLDRYQIRKTGKQKTEFMEFVRTFAEARGYSCSVEKGAFGVRNIVVGDPDAAKVVFGAHYDTCAVLPFPNFITPKHFGIYLLYQLLLVVGMLAVVGAVSGIAHGIALLAVVGRGMVKAKGTAARILSAVSAADVNIKMIDQGSSELNVIIGVEEKELEAALKAIYSEFVK